jgi:beta-lactamase superfamily II metal-dependent hydrolase/predicted nucleotidyltransferase
MVGLTPKELEILKNVFKKFDDIKEVILFGSRALGTHKTASDIDLAIKGNVDINTLSKLKYTLEEDTNLPYFFDVVIYDNLENMELKKHIDEFGRVIFKIILDIYNVEHGDSMLFKGNKTFSNLALLIDTGEDKYNIYKKISNEKFDIMITHQDNDHIGGLSDLLKNKLSNIENIYLPLYQPEIEKIFSKLQGIGKKNAKLIIESEKLFRKYISKVVFLYDGWHKYKKPFCNLSNSKSIEILNPPINNFDLFSIDSEFKEFSFESALLYIKEKKLFDDNFNLENYNPENFNNQNEGLINSRREYFEYVIRVIGYTIYKQKWTKSSANKIFTLCSNEISIILYDKTDNNTSILFTGDAGDRVLKNLINYGKLRQVDILKVSHHGGRNSVGKNILKTIDPKFAILSHGNKRFGRGIVPNKASVIELLKYSSINILATNNVSTTSILQIKGIYCINSLEAINFT